MADNDKSKIRYDDFISNVQPDPAKPESTIMLSGFVGHGPDGHARIYPDPTLGTWYDIPENDVVYSMPIADSKLGGSYIWVRASSEIKPGSAAPAASEAEAVQPQQAAAFAVNPTPRTHCHVCDPPMAAAGIALQPTPATHCFICPPHTQNCTPATICTLHGHCPQPQPSVPPTLCAVPHTLPCSLLCQANRAAAAPAAMALPHTAATVCTQILCTQGLATFCGCTPGIDCNAPAPQPQQTHFLCTQGLATFCGCTPGIDCMGLAARAAPQQANAGQTGVTVCVTDCVPPGNAMMKAAVGNPMDPTPQSRCFVCDPPNMLAAMQPTPTAQTHCFICPPHTQAVHCWTAPVVCDTMQMPTPATRCFICPPVNQTLATVCTQIGCPTHQIHCPTQPVVCNLQPTQPVVCGVLPPSFGCTQGCQQGGAPQQLEGVMAAPAHPNTAATLCTQQPACPPHTQAVHCWTAPVVCDTMQMPTPATRCFICPPPHPTLDRLCTQHCTLPNAGCTPVTVPPWVCGLPGLTPATVCTHAVHCPTQPVVCNLQPTQPVVCGVLPPSFGCQQGAGQRQPEAVMAAPVHPNTAATLCTQAPACPPHTIHNSLCICPTPSAFHPCGHNTLPTVCTQPPACPPGGGITYVFCPQTAHAPCTVNAPCLFVTIAGCFTEMGCGTAVACTPNGVFTPFGR